MFGSLWFLNSLQFRLCGTAVVNSSRAGQGRMVPTPRKSILDTELKEGFHQIVSRHSPEIGVNIESA